MWNMGQSSIGWTLSPACMHVCRRACVRVCFLNFSSLHAPPQAQLVDQRSELTEVKAEREVLEREVHDQLLHLHSLQLQLYAKQGQAEDSDTIKDRLVCRTREAVPGTPHSSAGTLMLLCWNTHTQTVGGSGEGPNRLTLYKKELYVITIL